MAGLPFIVPAIPSNSDATIVATASKFALSVYEWIDVQPFRDPDDIRAVNLIAELHRASRKHPVDWVPEDFNIPHRHHLETGLDELPESWVEGPFGERARALLATHRAEVRSALRLYDHLVAVAQGVDVEWLALEGALGDTPFVAIPIVGKGARSAALAGRVRVRT
jgi:hypothetical protein